jgi:hypothetical protein
MSQRHVLRKRFAVVDPLMVGKAARSSCEVAVARMMKTIPNDGVGTRVGNTDNRTISTGEAPAQCRLPGAS